MRVFQGSSTIASNKKLRSGLLASLLGARTLLVASDRS